MIMEIHIQADWRRKFSGARGGPSVPGMVDMMLNIGERNQRPFYNGNGPAPGSVAPAPKAGVRHLFQLFSTLSLSAAPVQSEARN
jgi:hypothetical protein